MKAYKQKLYLGGLALILAMVILSVYGACLGAERAAIFFNSPAMLVFWSLLILVLIAGMVVFSGLRRSPFLFLMHAGCLLVLAAGGWNCRAARDAKKHIFHRTAISKALLKIYPQQTGDVVYSVGDNEFYQLPFSIRLDDFSVYYYDLPYLLIKSTQSIEQWQIPLEVGKEHKLSDSFGSVCVNAVYKNMKINIEAGQTSAYEDPGPGSNPGCVLEFTTPDGVKTMQYVFANFPSHINSSGRFETEWVPPRHISDYISKTTVIENQKPVGQKDIEVNKPLYFKGYHIYQHSWGTDRDGVYSVLQIVSADGLSLVFAGFVFIAVGAAGHFWKKLFIRPKPPVAGETEDGA